MANQESRPGFQGGDEAREGMPTGYLGGTGERRTVKILGARESRRLPHAVPRLSAFLVSALAVRGDRLPRDETNNAVGLLQSPDEDCPRTDITSRIPSLATRWRWKC